MVKNLMIYTLFLVIIDFPMNVAINFIQGNPSVVIVVCFMITYVPMLK